MENTTYWCKLNKFADIGNDELKKYTGFVPELAEHFYEKEDTNLA